MSCDNAVNLDDLGIELLWFDRYILAADLNGDGIVGLTDMGIVLLNYGLVGAEWA